MAEIMKRILPVSIALVLLALTGNAHAVLISMTTVGDAGNAADQNYGSGAYGAVGYTYNIGKYEVSNAQYAEFLNAVAATDTYALYNTTMSSDYRGGITRSGVSGSYTYAVKSGYANMPVVYTSFYDAIRFSNWLNNGQGGAGTTETGAYTITGGGANSGTIGSRNGGATVWLPSEDEWYKAAYYNPLLNGGSGGYYLYPTQSSTAPTATTPTSSLNSANYGFAVFAPTDVGAYTGSASHYGTYDQGGNVSEWNEAIILSARVIRGGNWLFSSPELMASYRNILSTGAEFSYIGFRVASLYSETPAAVPEPSAVALFAVGGLVVWRYGSRRRSAISDQPSTESGEPMAES